MNLRPVSHFMPLASALQVFIFSSVYFLPDKQVFMNFLRSSPFMSLASTLHDFIFACCAVLASAAAAGPADGAAQRKGQAQGDHRNELLHGISPLVAWVIP